jgi:predicted O-methyltransferase YrrM
MQKVKNHVQTGYGIDIKPNAHLDRLRSDHIHIYYGTTNDFFKNFSKGIDMAFIDADHCYDSVLVDFENIYKLLNPGGIILLHDTDPENNNLIAPGYCGDSYRMVEYLENKIDINAITLPLTEAGLTIVTKKNDTRTSRRLIS